MRIGKTFLLTPNESKRYTIEYNEWLDAGETIVSKIFTVEQATIPPFAITNDLIDVSGTLIGFYAGGGVDGTTYKVVVQITTSNAQVKEDHMLFQVRDT